MRKIFQHKYIVRLLAFAALTLTLFVISSPKIEQYNQTVEKEQIELRKEADGIERLNRFNFSGIDYRLRTDYYGLAICFSLFISLLLTKRIIFSFLAVFLYTFQFATFYWFIFGYVFEDVEIPMRRELNTYLFDGVSGNELFFINFGCIAFLLALSYWQSSVICRFSRAVSFGFKTKIINRLKKDLA